MFCPSCGKEISDGATFCPGCGSPIKAKAGATGTVGMTGMAGSNAQQSLSGIFNKSKMNIYGIIASALILLSVFLPFVSVDFFGTKMSVSLLDGSDGILFIIIAIVGAVVSVLGKNIIVIITGAVSTLFFFIENANLSGDDDYYSELASSMLQKGPGYFFLLIGSLGLLIAGIVVFVQKKNNK